MEQSSRGLATTSDLVVLAPWKSGLVEADEAISWQARLALTFRTIFQIRRIAREAVEQVAFADPIDRLEQIHSFRLKATERGMLLSVTYDFGWSPYARTLWGPAGPFLDLLCCHCKDYRLARETDLEIWSSWIRANELVSDYFYTDGLQTVGDAALLAEIERTQRETGSLAAADMALAKLSARTPAEVAAGIRSANPRTAHEQALRILSAMFRLSRYYGTDITKPGPLAADALTLLRATRAQLEGWEHTTLPSMVRDRFARELGWFTQAEAAPSSTAQAETAELARSAPPAAPKASPAPRTVDHSTVQRGVLTSYDAPDCAPDAVISHGAALYFCLRPGHEEEAMRALGTLQLASEAGERPSDGIFRNLAFTFEGMRRLPLPPSLLQAMPQALREGAAARAPQMGDLHAFHPQAWQHLPRNWPLPDAKAGPLPQVDVATVDIVIQLRTVARGKPIGLADPNFPLRAEIDRLAKLPGLILLSAEALAPADPDRKGVDHLGFQDGVSQPLPDLGGGHSGTTSETEGGGWSDTVPLSQLLADDGGDPMRTGASFLAIRRMPLDREVFDALLATAETSTGLPANEIAARIVGRNQDGTSPVAPGPGNDFTYASDADGTLCPRQSHARRANPRTDAGETPRIMRRGMSFHPDSAVDGKRGSLFMAYCGNLAEQYEVVLQWLNGANSSRVGSWLADPLCGMRSTSRGSTYRFLANGKVHRVSLPPAGKSFLGLSWSLYLYVPSCTLVKALPDLADQSAGTRAAVAAANLKKRLEAGAGLIKMLQASRAGSKGWRAFLDEPGAREAGAQRALWAAIRHLEGGMLETPAGLLVGSHALVLEVLRDKGCRFSVRRAARRIRPSLGRFHLGMDACTADYARESATCNDALRAIDQTASFDSARRHTAEVLLDLLASKSPVERIDLVRDLFEPVTARMAPAWFGLPDGTHMLGGASDWRDIGTRKPLFPGDFWNSSRYAFNPFTSVETQRLSALHGKAVVGAAIQHVKTVGRHNLPGSVAKAIGADHSSYPNEADVGRVLTGAMMGWVATTIGNAARLFDRWLTEGDLARQQQAWLEQQFRCHAQATAQFGEAMAETIGQSPVPECKHRVVACDGVKLAGKPLKKGQFVILSLESAVSDQAERGIADSYAPFGMAHAGGQPPHGCPGRDMALGMLAGLLAGVMETVDMRPGGGRLIADIRRRPG